jgi:hypothetical protein
MRWDDLCPIEAGCEACQARRRADRLAVFGGLAIALVVLGILMLVLPL